VVVIPPTSFPFEGDTVAKYGGEHLDIRWPDEWKTRPGWRPYNPSVAWHKGRLYCSVRYSFFAFPGIDITGQVLVSSNYYGRSETILAELDPDTLQVKSWQILEYRHWSGSRNSGLEDIRIWSDGDHLYGIGVFLHLDESNHSQAIIRIDPAKGTATLETVIPSPRVEKNWLPIEGRDLFAYSPTQLVDRAGNVTGEPYAGKIHGGTQLLEFDDGYLSLVHYFTNRRYRNPGLRGRRVGRHYVHYWAKWDHEKITHLSRPFVFNPTAGIEFASGLTRWNDKLLVSWGWGDYDLTCTTVDPTTIQLEPFDREARFLIGRR